MSNWISGIIEIAVICFLYELWRECKKAERQKHDSGPRRDNDESDER